MSLIPVTAWDAQGLVQREDLWNGHLQKPCIVLWELSSCSEVCTSWFSADADATAGMLRGSGAIRAQLIWEMLGATGACTTSCSKPET